MPFIGFPITSQNAPKKKSREFPVGGPSPFGKTGLAPCRQCPSFFFFLCFFLIFFWPNLQMQNQKSKIHKQTYKITPPKGMKQSLENMFFCFIIVVFRAVHWVSHHVPKRPKKKSREFPLGGPGKTGLAPCRQCTFFFLFGCFFFFSQFVVFCKSPNPNPKIQNPKIKTPKSRIQNQSLHQVLVHDRSPKKNGQIYFCKFMGTASKISKWQSGTHQKSCKVRLINVCFLKIWNKLQKCAEKKSREFCLQVRVWAGAAPPTNNTKYCTRHF